MPLGFFFMAGGWTMILCGLIGLPLGMLSIRRVHLRRWVAVLAALFVLGLVLLAMMPIARGDARGDPPPFTDHQVQIAVLVIQAVLWSWVGRTVAKSPLVGRRESRAIWLGYGLVIAIVGVRLALGDDLSGWIFVPAVALAAARFAELPLPSHSSDAAVGDVRGTAARRLLSFTWTVAVLALECELLNRASGLPAFVVAFAVGLVIVAVRLPRSVKHPWRAVSVALAAFLPILFWMTLLMPSLAGARYLLDVGLGNPSGLRPASSGYVDGAFTRWYSTNLNEADALVAVTAAFRKPPVSSWPTSDGHGVTGHIFGYRIEVQYLAGGTALGATPCEMVGANCVTVVVHRSTT